MRVLTTKLFNTNKVNSENMPVLLAQAEDLSTMPFMARMSGSVSECLLFLSRTFASRTEKGKIQGCRDNEFVGWIYHKSNGLACVVICDEDYEKRVALGLIQQSIETYESTTSNWDWSTYTEDIKKPRQDIQNLLARYQTPHNEDSIAKISRDLEETRTVLHDSIDKMLDRGEKIDKMVEKSQDLSRQSKQFYRKSKKLNSWCSSCCIS